MNPGLKIEEALELRTRAVSVAFLNEKPDGLPRAGVEPAGCGYWRRAAEGESFYTEAEDHLECPIGAHTHGVKPPEARKSELERMLTQMCDLCYISMDEVPAIAHRDEEFRFAAYAPVSANAFAPDAVLYRGPARQLMLLAEASVAAGVAGDGPALGRPTCAVLPAAISTGKTAASFGCVGNRVYTAARDEDAYFAVPGPALEALAEKLALIVKANKALEVFHRQRAA